MKMLSRLAVLLCLMVGAAQAEWSLTGSMNAARYGHTATLLANGKVLVVGGHQYFETLVSPYWRGIGSAELYDPATGRWSATGSLKYQRGGHMAVRLNDGRVLVMGGDNGYVLGVSEAEIYDPRTGTWSDAGSMSLRRLSASATLLADGRVLVAGGARDQFSGFSSAELYDPATGLWRATGSMSGTRTAQKATLLKSGKVLIVGGSRRGELYDPLTERWTLTSESFVEHLWDHQVALLPSGKVLVFGGGISGDDFCNGVNNAEVYDPDTNRWSVTNRATTTRNDYTHSDYTMLLPNGKLLVVGGMGPGCVALKSAELYDPLTESWSSGSSMVRERSGHTLTMLANGHVLAAGGDGISAEVFNSGAVSLTNISAASFVVGPVAPESIVSAFGENLGTDSQATRVTVRDHVGVERTALLFYVSPGQINYQVPAGTATGGLATVTVATDSKIVASGVVEIADVAPGLFSVALRTPVDLESSTDQVFLVLYGTGIRFRSGLASVSASIGGVRSEVVYAGPAPGFAGLDQVNVLLPRSLAGRGEVEVALTVDGRASNTVRVNVR